MRKKTILRGVIFLLSVLLLAGCGQTASQSDLQEEQAAYVDQVDLAEVAILEEEAVALTESPVAPLPTILEPVASGTLEKRTGKAVIDYSNSADGYAMVQFTGTTTQRLKAQVTGPTTTYTYNITPQQWATFPLSDGNGTYKVAVYENVTGTKYAAVASVSFSVQMKDEFTTFLYPNQYVDYGAAPEAVAKAAELTEGLAEPLDKVEAIYDYVIKNLTYDKEKAATVKSGYLPVLDQVLAEKKGICFDYAALMTGMLRSQEVPCKMIIGYAGEAYHAWISVWSQESGWVDGAIFFDGQTWHRMDPTFASTGNQSAAIMKYIGDGSHYSAKYLY